MGRIKVDVYVVVQTHEVMNDDPDYYVKEHENAKRLIN